MIRITPPDPVAESIRRLEIDRLRAMPYQDYLKTEHWQNLRRKVVRRSGGRCEECGIGGVELHVHHISYARRGYEEPAWDLSCLCAECHKKQHPGVA